MPEPDLVLLHAPSVYDFRQEAILYGPIADFVPVPYAFELYPLGYSSLADFVEQAGYPVRILNLARHMLDGPRFDAEATISSVNPIAFLIDFHWLSHAQGALAVAQIVKTVKPETPVIFEGFAAAYYHRELMNYPQVDYVLCGESVETSLLQLLKCISKEQIPEVVPGLTWRNRAGDLVENPPDETPLPSPDDLPLGRGGWSFTCQANHQAAVRVMARGCNQNCLTCGTSAYAYQRLYGRQAPGYRSPELLARDLDDVRGHNGSVYIPGDITQAGMDYAYRFLQAVQGYSNLICLDLFQPVPRKFLQDVSKALPRFVLQISIESHDPRVRQAIGKGYSTPAIEQTIGDALAVGCERVDLQFSIGLPHQDYDSVMKTVAYCDHLLTRFHQDGGRLQPFITPLAPFLDPGSIAFQEPDRSGYRLLHHSLEEHRRALLAPSWKHVLNYETEWMSRDDIVRATYDATIEMAQVRAKHGLVSADYAHNQKRWVARARQLMAEIDHMLAASQVEQLHETLRELKPEIDELNRVGLWYNRLASAEDEHNQQTVSSDSEQPRAEETPKRWNIFKGWRRRRDDRQSEDSESNLFRTIIS
jgi:radical SAM superfamily enzyme YgiQ (UPF0313 family)